MMMKKTAPMSKKSEKNALVATRKQMLERERKPASYFFLPIHPGITE
jgi:hypothetical protein